MNFRSISAANWLRVSALWFATASCAAFAQPWDVPSRLSEEIATESQGRLRIGVEFRGRYEGRTGVNFGRDADIDTALFRTRFSLNYRPGAWIKLSAMVQDSRSPGYGPRASSTVRDPADLQEGYLQLYPDAKEGFGLTIGRQMFNLGEGRLIGSPQWGNVSRAWDHARVYYRLAHARFEVLLVSPVKVRMDGFNHPVLGDRIWGTYNTFTGVLRTTQIDAYFLRHDQNRIGGFTAGSSEDGTDRLRTDTIGGRVTGPLGAGLTYDAEGALQFGTVGPASHRAGAWYAELSRHWTAAGRPLDVSAEHKFASGTSDPRNTTESGTFDQLYPSNHDKFGHQDLFGWRNIHDTRALATLGVTKRLSVSFMYNSFWLASARDALYSGSGKAIVRSPDGGSGRHVGQEADLYGAYKFGHLQFGLGYGYLFKGEFIRNTTPGASPSYFYAFHSYTL